MEILCEIEYTLNKRPMLPISDDITDYEMLLANNFVIRYPSNKNEKGQIGNVAQNYRKKGKISVKAIAKIRVMDSLAEFIFTSIVFFHISVTQSTEEIGKCVMSKKKYCPIEF